ncbi:SDR family oxidoreductase [soil metagenome]
MPIALITGATAGIGAEYARQLAARGMDLVLVARDRPRLESAAEVLREEFGIDVEVLVADLLDGEQLAAVERRVGASSAPIDYLVNNAGFGLAQEFADNTVDAELAQFDILARVPLRLIHAALTQMLPRRTGTIVTVSSTAGYAGLGSYSAAKAWSLTFSRWANAYYRSSGVTLSAIAPGFVRTEFHERMSVSRESMAPAWLWLDASTLVRKALRDVDRRKAVSLPTVRYKIIVGLARMAGPAIALAVRRRGTADRRG